MDKHRGGKNVKLYGLIHRKILQWVKQTYNGKNEHNSYLWRHNERGVQGEPSGPRKVQFSELSVDLLNCVQFMILCKLHV